MASKSRTAAKSNDKQFAGALRKSARQTLASAQGVLQKAQDDSVVAVSRLAQRNILAVAKRADQFSRVLTVIAARIEPSARIATKSKTVAKKVVAKAAPKTGSRKSALAA